MKEIARVRARTPASLWLDCGDAIRAGNVSIGLRTDPTLLRMAAAGCTAMAMGNRETHLWWWALRAKLRGVSFPVLSSNLWQPRPPILTALQRECGGVRVGILALTPVMTPVQSRWSSLVTVRFSDPLQAAADAAAALRPEVDLVIVLSHQGRSFDRKLAESVPGIDLIIGGHDHSPGLRQGERIGSTLIARSSAYGADLGEVIVAEGIPGGNLTIEARLQPLIG